MIDNSNCRRCRLLRCVVAVIVAVSMMGCTSLRTVHPASGPDREAAAVPVAGDKLVVSLKDGGNFDMELKKLTPDALVGTRAGEEVSIALSDIEKVERREVDTLRTVLAVVLVVGVLQVLRGLASFPGKALGGAS